MELGPQDHHPPRPVSNSAASIPITSASKHLVSLADVQRPFLTNGARYLWSLSTHELSKKSLCSTSELRKVNGPVLLLGVFLGSFLCRRSRQKSPRQTSISLCADLHCAFNIALFPPLFFFSALYYTDVISTAFCLVAYLSMLQGSHSSQPNLRGLCLIVSICMLLVSAFGGALNHAILSVCLLSIYASMVYASGPTARLALTTVAAGSSLLFRQTNVFWASIYPLGLMLSQTMPQQLDTGATKASSEVSRQITRSNLPGDRPIYDASALGRSPHSMMKRLPTHKDQIT